MVKRKYLTPLRFHRFPFLVIIFFCLQLVVLQICFGNAWLPKKGKYKYSLSHMLLDSESHEWKEQRQEAFQQFCELEDILMAKKNDILEDAKSQLRDLRNSDKVKIQVIDSYLKAIENQKKELSNPAAHSFSDFVIEYAYSNTISVGTNIKYDVQRFDHSNMYGKSAVFFSKHVLLANNGFILTVSPNCYSDDFNKKDRRLGAGGAVYLGHSGCTEKQNCRFREIGFDIKKGLSTQVKKTLSYRVNFQEGITFHNGFSISFYTEVEFIRQSSDDKENNFYEQISVAKDILFASLGRGDAVIQLGYFWKGNLNEKFNTISGPILSIWFVI